MKRFAIVLLFQYLQRTSSGFCSKRMCEKRIINVYAKNGVSALKKAKQYAKKAEFENINEFGNEYFFQFVGITDIQHLGIECSEEEVWYDVFYMLTPMERKDRLIPTDENLLASLE